MSETNNKSAFQGIIYGLVPHIGCILFILGSVLGVTVLVQIFRPMLLNPYFFYILIFISLSLATISSVLYLKKNGILSISGLKRKWKYLSLMYGSTIGVNLLLFFFVFPLIANASSYKISTDVNLSSLKMSVSIPCEGHASLITGELKKLDGMMGVQFTSPNIFNIQYDPTKTSKDQILSLEVFKTYKATLVN